MIAKVIINVSSSNVDQKYDYFVPKDMQAIICIGGRVKVPFGSGDRIVMGYVVSLNDDTMYVGNLKEIVEVIDVEPIITEKQMELASYIQNDCVSPLIRILNTMIPDGLQLKTIKYLVVNNYDGLDAELAQIFGGRQVIEYSPSLYKYNHKITNERKKENITLSYDALTTTSVKMINKYVLDIDQYFKSGSNLSEYISDILKKMFDIEPLSLVELMDQYELSYYMITSLVKKGYLKKIPTKVSRINERQIATTVVKYTKEEFEETNVKFQGEEKLPFLWIPENIRETEITIFSQIYTNISEKRTTLVICSDILSSYKWASMIRKQFAQKVACLNSTLSKGELLDYYYEILNNEYNIIVTTPMASLFPYRNLGTIMMMNSESDNYFNDQSPRYDLKKVMIKRAELENARMIMHSYSPTLSEYCRGLQKNYIMIDNRTTRKTHNVEVIDLKTELEKGNDSYISHRLIQKMRITMSRKKQCVLIINNRNYSSAVICRSCGYVFKCPRCELSLKYSKKQEQLICSACSYRIPYQKVCPNCSQTNFRLSGIGMEQVLEEIKTSFPNSNIVTIDKPSFEEYQDSLALMEEEKVNIVITTDTFARSLYTKHLGLVGIVNIDSIAMSSNYNANEKAYNLLSNSSSLLENDIEEGMFVIQTFNTDNYMLQTFITGEYKEFLKKEISIRKILKNEPFYFINRLLIKAKYEEMFVEADLIKKLLKSMLNEKVFIVGPTYNHTEMAVQLIVKHRLINISEYYMKIYEQYQNSTIKFIVDKYPKYL